MDSRIIKSDKDGVKEVLEYLKATASRFLDVRNIKDGDNVDKAQEVIVALRVHAELEKVISEINHALDNKQPEENDEDFPDLRNLVEII